MKTGDPNSQPRHEAIENTNERYVAGYVQSGIKRRSFFLFSVKLMIIKKETTSRDIALTYLDYIEIDNIISDCKQGYKCRTWLCVTVDVIEKLSWSIK